MIEALLIFIIPAILSYLLTPLVIRFAKAVGATDLPNERKIHQQPMPRMGGVAIYLSFMLALLVIYGIDPAVHVFSMMIPHKGVLLIASLLMVLVLGIFDDLRSLNPGQKFLVQLAAATLAYIAGFRIDAITHPLGEGILDLGVFAYPATVLWIVGITNAFNLIDGLDGLSSGISIIVALTVSLISYLNGHIATAFLTLAFAGSILGFLRYNFNPARIFLGDSGSLFLGFALAVFSMESSTKGSAAVAILVPILALGLPIMDTLLSMIRRMFRSILRGEPSSASVGQKIRQMFLPDRRHIHHQLLALGVSHRNVVLLLYLVSCLFGAGAFAITMTNNVGASLILIAVAIATLTGIRQLQYKEMAILRNGILLPLYESPIFRRTLFAGFLDLSFTIVAFSIAYKLAFSSDVPILYQRQFIASLTMVCSSQLTMFYFLGMYKSSFRYVGTGDVLKIIRTVGAALLATGTLFVLSELPSSMLSPTLFILDFYILLTLVAGSRLSFHILSFVFRREADGGRGVLLYGAGRHGMLMLQLLLNSEVLNMRPIGFLDDDPYLEGKRLNDYPIFGGHWKLGGILRRHKVDQILICSDAVKQEVFNRIKAIAFRNNIELTVCRILFEDVHKSIEFALPSPQKALLGIQRENSNGESPAA